MNTISKKLFGLATLACLAVATSSCLSEHGRDLKAIAQKEAIFANKHDSANIAAQLDMMYQTFVRKYPDDSLVPKMVFNDAQLNIYPLARVQFALRQLGLLYTHYPDSRYSANALFKAAFLNETKLGNMDRAKELYLQFAKMYPQNSLATDAKLSADNIGMSAEEQLKKAQGVQDSTNNATKP